MGGEVVTYSDSDVAEWCRRHFWLFVKAFWSEVPGAGDMIENWHMKYLCNELQIIAERVFKGEKLEYDLVINISPGTSKSTICSILFQPWCWTRMASSRHLIASHTDQLVLDFANKARTVIKGEKYRSFFPEIEFSTVQDTKGYFTNTAGGDRLTCTVAGKSPMGFHADFQIVDDPIDPKKVLSELELKTSREFMTQILPSRKRNKAVTPMILIMQRLHRQDPSAVVLEMSKLEGSNKVKHICLPAELPAPLVNPPELIASYKNNLMDPERLGKSVLADFKNRLGAYGYAGQFMQSPVPLGGGMFKQDYFNLRLKAAPYRARRVRAWDRASTQDGGCYTAGVLMAYDGESFYVEDCVHGQWEPDERNRIIKATALKDRLRYGPNHIPSIWVESEGGSSGKDANKQLAKVLSGFHVVFETVTGSKDVRAEPWASQVAAGNVYFVEDKWDLNGYVEEHCLFRPMPGQKRVGKYADQVDASSGAFNYLNKLRTGGSIRLIRFSRDEKKPQLHFVVCSREELSDEVVSDHPCAIISITDPPPLNKDKPMHAIDRLVDYIQLTFADVDPRDYQGTKEESRWDELIVPFDKPCRDIMIDRDSAKKLWMFLLKKREQQPQILFFQDEGDRRALSMAYAVCDVMGLKKESVIFRISDPEWKPSSKPPDDNKIWNQFVYEQVKAGRGLVC